MLNWLPWKYILRTVARRHRFLDPINVLAYLHRFSQPSEVAEPIELLRAGVGFHARGLINSKAIQHNLDWIWPHWVVRQFDPHDDAFIPRAFSITHINLTHRNWTAVGLPGSFFYPIVDPRGLVTPLEDGWSLDGWIIADDGRRLFPSHLDAAGQRLAFTDNLRVLTTAALGGLSLGSELFVEPDAERHPQARLRILAEVDAPAWFVLSLRPFNPEGVNFVHDIALAAGRDGWVVNDHDVVRFDRPPERHRFSQYHEGDVLFGLPAADGHDAVHCDVGMATAAALWRVEPGHPARFEFTIPLSDDHHAAPAVTFAVAADGWTAALQGHTRLEIPDQHLQFLYDAAVRTLILHTPDDPVPGPYTYKRFWFRDAVYILHALAAIGLHDRVEFALDRFQSRQTALGYFLSQEGEWDSNGQVLWMYDRFHRLSGRAPNDRWRHAIQRGAQWIGRKRTSRNLDRPHAGLLPAGFSAEHLGPNDFYYWDDFWAVAGLRAAARLMATYGERLLGEEMIAEAGDLMACIERSLVPARARNRRDALPASPYRRMDAGAIGSIVVDYPLQLWAPGDPRVADTIDYLIDDCYVDGAFFQDMIHSGYNAYLTIQVAQVLLRAGDPRWVDGVRAVAALASPTGQWPEAIHPRTRGGCMGDGQHVWAAAEWVLMIRSCFLREEEEAGLLIIGSGILPEWLVQRSPLFMGPIQTTYGPVSVTITPGDPLRVEWQAEWRTAPPAIEIRLPGFPPLRAPEGVNAVELEAFAVP